MSKIYWSDFYNEELGPSLPLTGEQQENTVSGVLPSGEGGGFDFTQSTKSRKEAPAYVGSGINVPFPYPNTSTAEEFAFVSGENRTIFPDKFSEEWWEVSGIIKTYPPNDGSLADSENQSGIFHYNGDYSRFSNSVTARSNQIEDFNIFNSFIYHEQSEGGKAVKIPFISNYRISVNWNPYG
jgi:hypothetical protein